MSDPQTPLRAGTPAAPATPQAGKQVRPPAGIRTVIVIPIYNHKDQIGATVARLAVHGLPILIVDDGSNLETRTVLESLATRPENGAVPAGVSVIHLPTNGGKGAAVMAGLRAAHSRGFTHALQIDADGQHDATDVPHFLAAAQRAPDAVVIGRPVYDDSVPAARLYGRYLTNVWVWIETLSFTIRDAMCGYRLYPLDAACALIEAVRLPTRMDFDIEILVRLYWRRLAFVTVPTRVVYASDGLSHFDMLWDNVRISRSHTRLVCGMLLRLPLLLWHSVSRRDAETARNWSKIAERGSGLGMRLLMRVQQVLGTRATRVCLLPVVAYFLATSRRTRQASKGYFERLAASSGNATPSPGWRSAFHQIDAFADAALDKVSAWSGRFSPQQVVFEGTDAFDALVASGRGALIIGAHLGNLEMARALAAKGGRGPVSQNVRVTAIVYTEHARKFNALLSEADPSFAERLVQVHDFGPQTAMMLQARIEAGEWLVIVGDRVPARDAGRTVPVSFLGDEAPFAQGPWIMAHALGCPVYTFFAVKERRGAGLYRLYFEAFADRISLPRARRSEAVQAHAQRFADRLAQLCREYPYQWFNFFDFWAGSSKSPHEPYPGAQDDQR